MINKKMKIKITKFNKILVKIIIKNKMNKIKKLIMKINKNDYF